LELDPDNIDCLNSVAQCIKCLTPEGQPYFNQCLPYYHKAISADPEDFETNFNIGILFYDQCKDAERAIHHLKIANNEEKNITALFNMGVIYEEVGDLHMAKDCYNEVLMLDPSNVEAKVNLGILLDKDGKWEAANRHLSEAAARNEPKAHLNLGVNLKKAGKLLEAQYSYKKCLELQPDNKTCLYNSGVLHSMKSEYSQAVLVLERSTQLDQSNVLA